ncbi:hypothetical protein ACIBEJ_12445 [Nonomuraea sp. NPDC050790]|uniref:hypothetical protein n=1 Tax=Nonomuraea sp. NPDC050790 TaxID=3364371 RepID=UPI003795E4DB
MTGDEPLSDEQLDRVLDEADARHLHFIASNTSMPDLLNSLIALTPDVQPPVHLVEIVVQARTRLREIAHELARAELHSRSACVIVGDERAEVIDRAVLSALAVATDRELCRLPELTRLLTVALARALAGLVRFLSPEDVPRDERVADNLSSLVEALAQAVGDAGELAAELSRAHDLDGVDASGADLSELEVPSPDLLDGVIWDHSTVWPPEILAWVRVSSEQVRAGVYRVTC